MGKIFGGVGVLIGIYLFVANGDKTVSIIKTLGTQGVEGIRTLQGR